MSYILYLCYLFSFILRTKGYDVFFTFVFFFLFHLRYKGRQRVMPTVPNQPSEAGYHFMFELAKTVLQKAGGTSSTSLFTQPASNNSHTGPHRNLHICAFQIGLYALGLSNCVSPNWLSRTYSSHVSWITGMIHWSWDEALRIQNEKIKHSQVLDVWVVVFLGAF